jgi:hypothetical protein
MDKNLHKFNLNEKKLTLLVAQFSTPYDAKLCKDTLSAIFEKINYQTDQIFKAQQGEASLDDISHIYAQYGFINETGWEQNTPIIQEDVSIIWVLPAGAHIEDAEDLLESMKPLKIEIHRREGIKEEWQMYPYPAVMPIPDEDELPLINSDEPFFLNPFKRILH